MSKLKTFKIALLALLMMVVSTVLHAQNTRGDKPARPLPRITQKSKPQKGKKVTGGARDISGRRLRTKNRSTAAQPIISIPPRYQGRPSRSGDQAARPQRGSKARIRSASARSARSNVYPNTGRYKPKTSGKRTERFVPNDRVLRSVRTTRKSIASEIPRKRRAAPLSASRPFVSKGKKNVYWGKFRKGEKAFTKDISGRRLRTKNFRTPKPDFIPQAKAVYRQGKGGDRTSPGRRFLGFISATKQGQRAWRGDISRKALKKNSSKNRIESVGQKVFSRKKISANTNRNLWSRTNRKSPNQWNNTAGRFKVRKPAIGGGSISGRSKNNGGNAIAVFTPPSGAGRVGNYSGSLKISGARKYPKQRSNLPSLFKVRRPEKGGGSISGRSKNNGGNAIAVFTPPSGAGRVGKYSGNLRMSSARKHPKQMNEVPGLFKVRRPDMGARSISGRSRNNGGNPIATRTPRSGAARVGNYSGNIRMSSARKYPNQMNKVPGLFKAKKPEIGGGSISARARDNGGNPVHRRSPSSGAAKIGRFSGNIKTSKTRVAQPRSKDLAGVIKIKRYVRGPEGTSKFSLKKKEPEKVTFQARGFQIKMKRGKYLSNPNANPNALKGLGPASATVKASEYTGRMKIIRNYIRNPSSNVAALKNVASKKTFTAGNNFQGRTRLTRNYRHSPNGNSDALKVIAPGVAYAKIGSYQGNTKMNKPHGKNLHPDAKFAHGHLSNVKQARTILVNAKLWWSRMFRQAAKQPKAVKDRVRKPHYDKRERELWKDLYD